MKPRSAAGDGAASISPDARDRVILALDKPDTASALALVDGLDDDLRWVKVGLELFTAEGPAVVRALRDRGRRVFLDLKLHDIPNTVAGAVRSAAALGVDLLTLHAEGGPAMLQAAARARDAAGPGAPRLLAVTVLTSLDGTEYPGVYRPGAVRERVGIFAAAAGAAGIDGVVCSPQELEYLASRVKPEFLRVTPGIRPAGSSLDDQSRVATPGSALAAGASHLVIGRAVTAAPDPRESLRRILREIEALEPGS